MQITSERYFPQIDNAVFGPYEPFISYEHWHRYCYALPFVTGKTALDIASGEGYGSAYLATKAARVYGVDLSEDAVRHAREAYARKNLTFLQGPASEIPISGKNCLDAIVSFETIEHLDARDQERFAREARRLLRPDGVLLVSTPNRSVYTDAADTHNPYHLREFTGDEYRAFLGQHFRHVQMLGQRVFPVSYLWNVEGRRTGLAEYQIALKDNRFVPGEADAKEVRYFLAVCTNRAEPIPGLDSLMVDLTDVAFRAAASPKEWFTTGLFYDSGSGYRADEVVYEKVWYAPQFSVTFHLNPTIPYRQLRWDPVDFRLCKLRLSRVSWQDARGVPHAVDPARVSAVGARVADGAYCFETIDPIVLLPISGQVKSVTIEGECAVEGEVATMQGMERLLAHRAVEAQSAKRRLEEYEQGRHRPLVNWVRHALSHLPRRLRTYRGARQAARNGRCAS